MLRIKIYSSLITKTRLVICVTYSLISNQYVSYSQSWQWATSAGGPLSDKATDIDIDAAGQLYVSGFYNVGQPAFVTANFGSIVAPAGSWGKEGFAAKVNSSGTWMWVNAAEGGWDERVLGLCTDKVNGYVYATGCTWNDINTFGNCGGTGLGSADEIFIGKFNLNGNCQWLITAGTDGDDHGYDLVADKQGNIYLTGFLSDHYGWFGNPGLFGSINVPMTTDSTAYVTKISPAGIFQWVRTFEAIDGERDNRVAVDTNGNVYVTGGFWGTKQFGSQTVISNGGQDIFVLKFDSNGNQLWVRTTGSTLDDRGNAITVDPFNDIYVTGEFRDKAAFDLDTVNNYGGPNGRDIFVAKIKTNGTWVWAKRAGSTNGGDRGNGIVGNKKGNIFVTGQFMDTAKFGGNISLINPTGGLQVFVSAIDTTGKWRWALQGGGPLEDRGTAVTCDDSCNVYVSGFYPSSASFGTIVLNSAGAKDAFVASISNACFDYCSVPVPVVTAADSAICPGNSTLLQVSSGNILTWNWSPATGLNCTSCTNPTATPTVTTIYSVIISDSCGFDTASITITVFTPPSATATASPYTIISGGQTTLSGNTSTGTYNWSPSTALSCTTCSDPAANPAVTTTYTLITTDINGCTAIDTVIVNVTDDTVIVNVPIECGTVFIPNAFSPNDDGENDVFRIYIGNATCIKEFNMIIYNRWSEKVFETNKASEGWDGTYREKISDTAVYYFYSGVTLINGTKIEKKGNVSLVR